MTDTPKCADLVQHELEEELEILRKLWALHREDPEAYDDDYGNLYEYGLAFDYVAPGTFGDQNEGYFRYQLSWGGPSDEFRIFADANGRRGWSIYRVEYWYMDWFDGASVTLRGDDLAFMSELVESLFGDSGTMAGQHAEAMEV